MILHPLRIIYAIQRKDGSWRPGVGGDAEQMGLSQFLDTFGSEPKTTFLTFEKHRIPAKKYRYNQSQ